jgi:hypothetical protein
MTAYNAQEESDYTVELKSFFGAALPALPASPEIIGALQAIYTILLK